jgi:hypothetical protein
MDENKNREVPLMKQLARNSYYQQPQILQADKRASVSPLAKARPVVYQSLQSIGSSTSTLPISF